MTLYVADFEANDLRPNADTIWCGILKPFQRSQVMRYYGKDTEPEIPYSGGCVYNFDYGLEVLKEDIHKNCTLIMHNGVQYDKWLLEHTLDITIPVWRIIDTLILSKLLWPNLKVPEGWKGKPRPHSIEAWGMRFGVSKPQQEEWDAWDPAMLHRCEQDVIITEMLYKRCLKEMNK